MSQTARSATPCLMRSTVGVKAQPPLLVSAILLVACGVALPFAPERIWASLARLDHPSSPALLQLLGGAPFALGFLDWLHRFAIIGGMHGRPLAVHPAGEESNSEREGWRQRLPGAGFHGALRWRSRLAPSTIGRAATPPARPARPARTAKHLGRLLAGRFRGRPGFRSRRGHQCSRNFSSVLRVS